MTSQSHKNIILIGFDWDILDLIETIPGLSVAGYIDNNKQLKNNHLLDIPHLGDDQTFLAEQRVAPDRQFVVTVDSPSVRENLHQRYSRYELPTLISPHANISSRSFLGWGCLIQRGVCIMPQVTIGNGCLLNVNACVHHETTIGDYTTLAPGAHILGRVTLGSRVYIGAGAIVKQDCKIGNNSIIGAGAVVVNDIAENSKVVGVPATRYLKST